MKTRIKLDARWEKFEFLKIIYLNSLTSQFNFPKIFRFSAYLFDNKLFNEVVFTVNCVFFSFPLRIFLK
jgi:hypothetical protein